MNIPTDPRIAEAAKAKMDHLTNWLISAIRGKPQFAWCDQKSDAELKALIQADFAAAMAEVVRELEKDLRIMTSDRDGLMEMNQRLRAQLTARDAEVARLKMAFCDVYKEAVNVVYHCRAAEKEDISITGWEKLDVCLRKHESALTPPPAEKEEGTK